MPEKLSEKLIERFSLEPKECLKKKLVAISWFLEDNLDFARKTLNPDVVDAMVEVREKAEKLYAAVEKMKPEQVNNVCHCGDILGQLTAKLSCFEALKKCLAKKDKEKIRVHRMLIEETIGSINDYLDLNLENRDYFYGEISDKLGYFVDKEFSVDHRKITDLRSDEFILLSKDMLSGSDSAGQARPSA